MGTVHAVWGKPYYWSRFKLDALDHSHSVHYYLLLSQFHKPEKFWRKGCELFGALHRNTPPQQ